MQSENLGKWKYWNWYIYARYCDVRKQYETDKQTTNIWVMCNILIWLTWLIDTWSSSRISYLNSQKAGCKTRANAITHFYTSFIHKNINNTVYYTYEMSRWVSYKHICNVTPERMCVVVILYLYWLFKYELITKLY